LGCSTIFGVNITNLVQQTTVNCIVTAAKIDTTPFQVRFHTLSIGHKILNDADIFKQEILNGQIKPGGTSVATSATSTAANTKATSTKAGKATGTAATAATATTAATAATGTGTGTGRQHHHFRGLRARNVWAQAS
jgi:hypothetical protein